ncbi:MAG: family 16 glycosylhydrolase [Tepidisphaeraceae bacterium]
MRRTICALLLAGVAASVGVARAADDQGKVLFDFEKETATDSFVKNDADFKIIDTDAHGDQPAGHALEIDYSGHGSYPAVSLRPASGTWDLSGASGVSADITNPNDKAVRVHLRVDNAGDWRKSPWSIDATTIPAGKTKTVKVHFGKSYGHDGFALDPSKIALISVILENPKGPKTLRVDDVKTFGDGAKTDSAADAGAQKGTAVAQDGALIDPAKPLADDAVHEDGASGKSVATDTGHAIEITFASGQYPALHLQAPGGGWNLSNFAGVEATLTNPGPKGITAAVRVDNPGNNAWNAEKRYIKPGKSETVRVTFGQSFGGAGFALNPAKVVRVVIYAERPKPDQTLLLSSLKPYGQATVRDSDSVDLKGVLFDFGSDFVADQHVEERGATAKVKAGKLDVTFDSGEQYPAVALKPLAKKWDLSLFRAVQMDLTNTSSAPAHLAARVDNPGANGQSHCNSENLTLAPGETKTLTVTFGQSWGKKGFDLDPSDVTDILVMAEKPKGPVTVSIDNVRALAREAAAAPEWVGQKPPVAGEWVQTLNENFDEPSLDLKTWTPRLCWDGPLPAETQRYRESNVFVKDGKLIIKCEKNPGHQYDNPALPTREYATGAMESVGKWTQEYGYFEARIKQPTARGLWPAFWMMPDRGEGHGNLWQRRATENGGMEIDIWEHLTVWGTNRYNVAAHWDGYDKDHKQWGNSGIYHLDTPDGWHNYGLLWEPGKLTWYCDGRQVAEWKNPRVGNTPAYLLFTVQMGNWATKNVDDAALPDQLQVDYVRAWQLKDRLGR